MNIYFACSITGGRVFESAYQEFTRILLEDGHEVPTAYLAGSNVMALEKVVEPRKVYERDVAWIRAGAMPGSDRSIGFEDDYRESTSSVANGVLSRHR
jgi:hypothetical protein